MKKEMTLWGVGPRFTIFSTLYVMLALAVHYLWYPAFVMEGIPYAVLVAIGLLLVAIGVPIWVAGGKAVDRAFEEGVLATQGVYALCRHPIYGNAIFFTIPGVLLLFRSWLLLSVPLVMYAFHKCGRRTATSGTRWIPVRLRTVCTPSRLRTSTSSSTPMDNRPSPLTPPTLGTPCRKR